MSKLNPLTSQPTTQLLPTPLIGMNVQYWRDDLMPGDPVAAMVVRILAPGRVQLAILEPDTQLRYRTGVHWAGDDRRLDHHRPYKLNGVWDYIPGTQNRDATRLHKDMLEAASKDAEARERQERERRERLEREHAERKNAITQDVAT